MLATITFLLMGPVLTTQDPPRSIDGMARIAGTDRPAARVKLHVFNQIDPAYTVDDRRSRSIPRSRPSQPIVWAKVPSKSTNAGPRPKELAAGPRGAPAGSVQPAAGIALGHGELGPFETRQGDLGRGSSARRISRARRSGRPRPRVRRQADGRSSRAGDAGLGAGRDEPRPGRCPVHR